MAAARWEHGSDFHDLELPAATGADPQPWTERPHRLYATGRDALAALLDHLGARSIGVPAYFCPDVVRALAAGRIVHPYEDGPWDAVDAVQLPAGGDVVLTAGFFGHRGPPDPGDLRVVEDHTHDPASTHAYDSRAPYCVASLRKTVPVPDGAVLWSPWGAPLPAAPDRTPRRDWAVRERARAMRIKRAHLEGRGGLEDHRRLALAAEAAMTGGPPAAISAGSRAALARGDLSAWRRRRAVGHATLRAALGDLVGARALPPAADGGLVPLGVLLTFDDAGHRDRARAALVAARVFTAVLWDLSDAALPGIAPRHLDGCRRVLSIPCDGRYDDEHLGRVAERVRAVVRETA